MVDKIVFSSKLLREALDGRTVTWLAEKTGITAASLYRILNEGRMPTAAELIAISEALSVKPEHFMLECEAAAA